MDPNDKNTIIRTVYKLNSSKIEFLVTYTELWYGPCSRIKTHFPVILKDYILVNEEYMEKTSFKENVNNFIPYFQKFSKEYDSIQTSDHEILQKFLSKKKETEEEIQNQVQDQDPETF